MHSFDPATPLEETLRALDDLVRQGKVRYIGCSNFAGWQLMKALAISDLEGLERFITLQAHYSLLVRDLENELLPLCLDQGLGVLVWSPLASGFLTGKYKRDQPAPEGSRLVNPEANSLEFEEGRAFKVVEGLESIAGEYNATPAQMALSYLLHKPEISSVIMGAKDTEQLSENLKSRDIIIAAQDMERLDELSRFRRAYPYWMLEEGKQERMNE
jgi:aryl-alcohol dehydrogenase-like predicted oxidoreductase